MDFTVENHGSICVVQPLSAAAREWLDENVGEHLSWAGGIVVEPRYLVDLVDGMLNDGLALKA